MQSIGPTHKNATLHLYVAFFGQNSGSFQAKFVGGRDLFNAQQEEVAGDFRWQKEIASNCVAYVLLGRRSREPSV